VEGRRGGRDLQIVRSNERRGEKSGGLRKKRIDLSTEMQKASSPKRGEDNWSIDRRQSSIIKGRMNTEVAGKAGKRFDRTLVGNCPFGQLVRCIGEGEKSHFLK